MVEIGLFWHLHCVIMLIWIVCNISVFDVKTVLRLNWIIWNRTVFDIETLLSLNWIAWNRTVLTFTYEVPSISFQTFFVQAFKIRVDLKIQFVIAIHLKRWLTNFYNFMFKWTATAAIGIHPTKACLSQLVNFKNAIWTWGHFRRTICNKILF